MIQLKETANIFIYSYVSCMNRKKFWSNVYFVNTKTEWHFWGVFTFDVVCVCSILTL